jgi:hypothetical protein
MEIIKLSPFPASFKMAIASNSFSNFEAIELWALQDLNLRPADYESAALTN